MMKLTSNDKTLSLEKPLVMGVLNLTPDSFSDGGKFVKQDDAIKRFDEMIEEGADIIDIGGESTGPGSQDVTKEEELERIIPVLKTVRERSDIWISVDTYKPEIAKRALEYGADMINDILAMRGGLKMAEYLATQNVPIILMYSKDSTGRTTGDSKEYEDIMEHLSDFFDERIKVATESDISRDRLILDPGQGAFVSANPKYSLEILKRLKELQKFQLPILIGSSRKSVIGMTLNLPLHDRLEGSLACVAAAIMNGASIVRVHDVKETRRLVDMLWAILQS